MSVESPTGVLDFLERKLGVDNFEVTPIRPVAVSGGATQLAARDPKRLFIMFLNMGSHEVAVHYTNNVEVGQGFMMAGLGSGLQFEWETDLTLPSMQWYGRTTSAGSGLFVHVIEGRLR